MKVDCSDYRKSMQLLALKKRLSEGIDDPHLRKEIEEQIKALQEELEIE